MASAVANPTDGSLGLHVIGSISTLTVSSQPTYSFPENAASCATEFDGNFAFTFNPLCYTVEAGALGSPTTGYQWSPAVTPHVDYISMSGGHNQSTSGGSGRTGFVDYSTLIDHNGQGDAGMFRFFGVIGNPMLPSETNFLAGKAIFGLAGNWVAYVAGGYEQGIGDLDFADNGFETAVIGTTYNFFRTVNTTVYGSVWGGEFFHAWGAKALDWGWALGGPAVVGIDFTQATGLSAAVNLATNQPIVLNSTASAIGGINWYGNSIGTTLLEDVSGIFYFQGQGGASGGASTPGYLSVGGGLLAYGLIATGASLPTTGTQLSFGTTTTANTNCGSVGTGCLKFYIGTTAHYAAYY